MDHSIVAALIIATSNIAILVMQTYLARKVDHNTRLTEVVKEKTEQTYHEMNSMKDALIVAEKAASELKGNAAGVTEGIAQEKARADSEKKDDS